MALAAAMLMGAGAAQAAMIEFDLNEFTGANAQMHITLDDDDTAGAITVYADVVNPPAIGDIRGIFFNLINDPGLTLGGISGSTITGKATNTSNLGGGNNVIPQGPFDFGLEFGTPGIGSDDLQSVQFLIDDLSGALTLADLGTFAGRLTSVGPNRELSSKLIGDPGSTSVPASGTLWLFAIAFGVLGFFSMRRRRVTLPA